MDELFMIDGICHPYNTASEASTMTHSLSNAEE